MDATAIIKICVSGGIPLNKKIALFLILLSVLPRVIFLHSIRDEPYFQTIPGYSDESGYLNNAREIASGNILLRPPQADQNPVYNQAPLYSYFLASIISIFGESLLAIRLFQSFLSVLCCLMIYRLSTLYIHNRWFQPIPAAFLSIYSPLIFYESTLLRPVLVMFLLTCCVFFLEEWNRLEEASKKKSFIMLLLGGLAAGAGFLTRPNMLLPILFVLIGLVHYGKSPRPWKITASFLLGIFIFLSPFMIRNVITGAPTLKFSTKGVDALVVGNHPDFRGVGYEVKPALDRIKNQSGGNILSAARMIVEDRRTTTRYLVKKYLSKLFAFFNHYEMANNTNFYFWKDKFFPLKLLDFRIPGLLGTAGLLGLLVSRSRRPVLFPLLIFWAYAASILIFYILARFRIPLIPLFCLFSGIFLQSLFDQVQDKNWTRLVILIVLLGGLSRAVWSDRLFLERGVQQARELYNYGTLLTQEKKYSDALKQYRQVETIAYKYPKLHNNMGVCYLKLGNFAEAIRLFEIEISLYPDRYESLFNLAFIYYSMSETEKAMDYYRRYKSLQASNAVIPELESLLTEDKS